MNKIFWLFLWVALGNSACEKKKGNESMDQDGGLAQDGGADSSASPTELETLLASLRQIAEDKQFLFGQQYASMLSKSECSVDGNAVAWKIPPDSDGSCESLFIPDIERATSLSPTIQKAMKPSVYGFNLGFVHENPDSTEISSYAKNMVDSYREGALITIHWPADNPVVFSEPGVYEIVENDKNKNGTNNDTRGAPLERLAAASSTSEPNVWNSVWVPWLNTAKKILLEAQRLNDGIAVPILFRPFHENLGKAHWWGVGNYSYDSAVWCSGHNLYVDVFRKTIEFLRNPSIFFGSDGLQEKLPAIENLGVVWSPGHPVERTANNMLDLDCLYPGDEWVDVIAFDLYEKDGEDFASKIVENLKLMSAMAKAKGKISAIAEFGVKDGFAEVVNGENWYMSRFLQPLRAADLIGTFSYAMTWTNRASDSYWVPLPAFEVGSAQGNATVKYPLADLNYGFDEFVLAPESVFGKEFELYR